MSDAPTYSLYRIATSDYVFWYGAFAPAHALQRWLMDYGDTSDEEEIECRRITPGESRTDDELAATEIIVSEKPLTRRTVREVFEERRAEHVAKGDTSKPQFSIVTAFLVGWPGDL
jgi:hypothetical protein